MEIPKRVLDEVYAHARATYPEECCGFLIGDRGAGGVDEARRCENRQNALHAEDPTTFTRDARTAYNIGAKDLFFLEKSQRGPRPVRIVYHSHVEVGAYFSAEDRTAALSEGEPLYPVDYLVADARKDGCKGARLFRFDAAARDFVEIASYPGE